MSFDCLKDFLASVEDVKRVNDCAYKFKYNSVQCLGLINKMSAGGNVISEIITIRPTSSADDIGNGCGEGITINFKLTSGEQ